MRIVRLNTEVQVRNLIGVLNALDKPVALDIETTGLDPWKDSLLTVVISGVVPDSAYLFGPELAPLLTGLTTGLILHNFKFDYQFLYRKGINLLEHDFRDTMLMHHLLDENKQHSLDSIIQERYGDSYKAKFWAKYEELHLAPQEEQDEYAGKDVIYTRRLYRDLVASLEEDGVPQALIKQVHRFALGLLRTEIEGVCVDVERIKQLGIETLVKIDALQEEMRGMVATELDVIETDLYLKELNKRKTDKGKARVPKPEFSFGSTQQLHRLLYEELGLPEQLNTQRKVTVDDNALSKLEGSHPLIEKLREYRGNQKLFSAFLETALERARNGRIYPSFNVNGTVTGRISASNPNLQQLPSSGGIRGIYVPKRGHSFISADYKQLEVTLAAHFSRDTNLLRVVNEGVSLHDLTAEGLGIDRSLAKTINFAIQYGAGVSKVQKILKCTKEKAEESLAKYWATYPGLKALIDRCHRCVDQGKAIVNPFGRQRRLVVENPRDKWAVAGVKRQAFNSLIQGTGADITNLAFILINDELINSGNGRAMFVVHDEILIEVLDESVLYWNSRLKEVMSQVGKDINLTVPLLADASGGMKSWLD